LDYIPWPRVPGRSSFVHEARNLFRKGKEAVSKTPTSLITDGLLAYHGAFKKEFWRQKNPLEYVSAIRMSGGMNNNKMERFNGEVRDREKVMRNLKKKDIYFRWLSGKLGEA
jgi:putative transposase